MYVRVCTGGAQLQVLAAVTMTLGYTFVVLGLRNQVAMAVSATGMDICEVRRECVDVSKLVEPAQSCGCVRVCVCVYVRACMRAWVRACVRGCVRACVGA